jgi:D-alanine-D-alanine ligase
VPHLDDQALEAFLAALAPRLRVAVIHGGDKTVPGAVLHQTPNCRPWRSYERVAAAIARTLETLGFRDVALMPDDRHLPARLEAEGIQLAWLNTGGVQGRDPMAHAPATLELLGIPYIGHDPLNASRLDNKHVFKRELQALGLPTAPFVTWAPARGAFDPAAAPFDGPFVVKPVSGRASLLVEVVPERAALTAAVARVHQATRSAALVEPFLPGREFCVSVGGPVACRGRRLYQADGPIAFSALERVLDPGEAIFASMDQRPLTPDRARTVPPGELRDRLHDLARRIYEGFDLEFLARVDVRMDARGQLMVLEANPKPDLQHGDGAVNLTTQGMDYADLIMALVAERLQRALLGRDLGHEQLQGLSGLVPAAGTLEPHAR